MTRAIRGGFVACALAALAPWGTAQTTQQQIGTIVVPDVTLRAMPKADAPDAGQLVRGVDVIVHHAEGDEWLAIQPPPGTISWIKHLFVSVNKDKGFPQNAVVHADGEVKLAAGRAGVNKPLESRRTSVPDGTIVRIIGAGVTTEDDRSIWYPIQPLKDDFRYIPRSSVQLGGPSYSGGYVVKSPSANIVPTSASSNITASIPSTSAKSYPNKPAGWPTNTIWVQAEAAEQSNDFDKAEQLYFQVAKEANAAGGDAELANQAYIRIHALRERKRQVQGGAEGGQKWTPKTDERTGIRADPKSDEWSRRNDSEPRADWTGVGYLRASTVRSGTKPYYVLEDARGNLLYYAVAGSNGIDLEKYLKKKVDLFGTRTYPQDLRVGVVSVTRVDQAK